jgi:predicted DNA-binding transcriptional regulator YafY
VSKLERLLNLTAVLINTPRPLTAEQLRTRVGGYPPPGTAFHRAFERDKDDLRVLGIPLRVERAPGTDPPSDGYRIDPDDYYLPDPGLEPDELAALHLASLTVRVDGLGDREALWKLGGVLGSGAEPQPEHGVASLPTDPALVPLFQAIVDRRQVTFGYRGEQRTVDPWRLDYHRGRWYLTGFDHLRSGERHFRLERIEDGVKAAGPMIEPAPPRSAGHSGPAAPWELGGEELVVARIRVDAGHVVAAERQLGQSVTVEPEPDGSAVFAIPVVNFEAFRTFLFGLLDHAELLDPPRWRDAFVGWLEAVEASDG